jgi:lysylphosphatidylglycerol synthetase-like protein (DUF2156 family)
MFLLATPIVDWTAMWKILVAVLVAGVGTVVVFGFLLLGLKLANRLGTGAANGEGSRIVGYSLAGVCAVLVSAVVMIGIYAMTQKPKSKPATKPKSALVVPAGSHARLIATTR